MTLSLALSAFGSMTAALGQESVASPGPAADHARALLTNGDAAGAERAFRRLLLADSGSAEAMAGWALALHEQGRGREALSSLRRLAEEKIDLASFEEAARLLEVAVEISAEDPALRSRWGQALALAERHESAEEVLREAYLRGARDPGTLLYWASSLWETERLEEAEARYLEAVAASGRSPSALHQLGRLLLWQSRFAEAVEVFDEAAGRGASGLDFDLDQARALLGAAERVAAGEGDGAGSEEELARALEAQRAVVRQAPDHSGARYGLMMALRRAGRVEEAARESAALGPLFEADRQRARDASRIAAKVATARRKLDDGDAEGALRIVAEIDGDVEALRLRSLALRRLGDAEQAALALREAIALAPERRDLRALLRELERE